MSPNGGSPADLFGRKRPYAHGEDTILSRPVKRAADALAKQLKCWGRLDPLTRDELANARHLYDAVVAELVPMLNARDAVEKWKAA